MYRLRTALFRAENAQHLQLRSYTRYTAVNPNTESKAETLFHLSASFISSTFSLLPFQFLLNSEINDTRAETSLLRYFKIAFSTLYKVPEYTGALCFKKLSVVRPPLVAVCYELQRNCLFLFITRLSGPLYKSQSFLSPLEIL